MRILCASLLLLSLAACTEKDNDNDNNPASSGTGTNGDASVQFTIGTPSWEQDGHIYYATYDWTAEIKDASLKLRSFYDEGEGKDFSFGIGYAPEGVEGGRPRYFNGDKPENSHEIIAVNNDSTVFTIRSRVKADNRKEARAFVYLSDGQFHYSNLFYIDPAEAPQIGNEIAVALPEQVSHTATSITVESHFIGNITGPEQFQNASCGFVWCHESEGAPTMNSQSIDCTQSAWQNNGQRFEGTITGLEPGQTYNVAAWVRMSPDSEAKMSDWHSLSTQSGDNPGSDNWVSLVSLYPVSNSTILVTVTAFFNGNPSAVGVVYNNTGEPTTADYVYNALDHLNMSTGEHDETVQRIQVNADGSRTVAALISGLQPGALYYFRAYAQFSDGSPTIYSDQLSETTPE